MKLRACTECKALKDVSTGDVQPDGKFRCADCGGTPRPRPSSPLIQWKTDGNTRSRY